MQFKVPDELLDLEIIARGGNDPWLDIMCGMSIGGKPRACTWDPLDSIDDRITLRVLLSRLVVHCKEVHGIDDPNS